MLKALRGFTLPDDTRVERGTLVEDDFASKSVIRRLFEKGALEEWVDPTEGENPPATDATAPAPELSDAPTTSTTPDESQDVTEPQEESDDAAR